MKSRRQTKIWIVALVVAGIFCASQSALSLPSDYEVKNGTADIQVNGNEMTISASENAIIDFGTFNIAENESVFVTLPTANSQILNRVTGGTQSDIFGDLTCNGLFILVNEAGIHIGENADINVGSIILSTRDITNSNFVDGNYLFERLSAEALDRLLLNEGTITVTDGGFGVMIAGAVENRGVVTARLGKVVLAGGDAVTVNLAGPRSLISIAIQEKTASSIVDYDGNSVLDQIMNSGTLSVDGGTVVLDAESVTDVFRNAINLEGYVNAAIVEETEGIVRIVADGDVVINAEVEATHIEIGDADTKVPENVTISGGYLEAEETITVLANSSITVNTNISTTDGDINLYADYDGDATGTFSQTGGVISAGGAGDVYIDGSLVMEVGEIQTGTGEIRIGTLVAPEMIIGDAYFVHNSGNFDIDAVTSEDGITILETVRGDVLRYATEGNVTLETPRGDINTAPGVVVPGNRVKLSGQRIGTYDNPVGINANITYINRLQGDIDITSMWGLGSTLYIRGPAPSDPDAWGAISYNLGSDLVLEAENVNIISDSVESVDIDYDTFIVASNAEAFYFYGNVTFCNFNANVPWTQLYFEPGKTVTFKGTTTIGVLDDTHASVFMRSHEQGETWYIANDSDSYVYKKVVVQDSRSLNEDTEIYASPSSNWGGNMGWDFNTVYWGSGTSNWSVEGNWFGGVLPTALDDVVFDTAEDGHGGQLASLIDAAFSNTIASLTISSGASGWAGTLSVETDLTVTGDIIINGGTLDIANGTQINVGGNWDNTGGTVDFAWNADWTVVFDGAGTSLVTSDGEDFYNFTVDNASCTVEMADILYCHGNVRLEAGTLDPNGYNLLLERGWYVDPDNALFRGGLAEDANKVYFDAYLATTFDISPAGNGADFWDVTFYGNDAATQWDITGDMTVKGDMCISDSYGGGTTMTVASGTLTANSLDVQMGVFNVNDSAILNVGNTFSVRNSGTVFNYNSSAACTVGGAFHLGSATFNILRDGFEMSVGGNWSSSGTVAAGVNAWTVTFDGTDSGDIYLDPWAGVQDLCNVIINKTDSSDKMTLWNDMTVTGDLTITKGMFNTRDNSIDVAGSVDNDGTLQIGNDGAQINVAGNWDNTDGTISAGSNAWTVVFDGAGASEITLDGESFHHLTMDKTEVGSITLADWGVDFDGNVRLEGGNFYTFRNGEITVGGGWYLGSAVFFGGHSSYRCTVIFDTNDTDVSISAEKVTSFGFVKFHSVDGTGSWNWNTLPVTTADEFRIIQGTVTITGGYFIPQTLQCTEAP